MRGGCIADHDARLSTVFVSGSFAYFKLVCWFVFFVAFDDTALLWLQSFSCSANGAFPMTLVPFPRRVGSDARGFRAPTISIFCTIIKTTILFSMRFVITLTLLTSSLTVSISRPLHAVPPGSRSPFQFICTLMVLRMHSKYVSHWHCTYRRLSSLLQEPNFPYNSMIRQSCLVQWARCGILRRT